MSHSVKRMLGIEFREISECRTSKSISKLVNTENRTFNVQFHAFFTLIWFEHLHILRLMPILQAYTSYIDTFSISSLMPFLRLAIYMFHSTLWLFSNTINQSMYMLNTGWHSKPLLFKYLIVKRVGVILIRKITRNLTMSLSWSRCT